MICHSACFLKDPEVAELFDVINMKLGMSEQAAKKFRSIAVLLAETKAT